MSIPLPVNVAVTMFSEPITHKVFQGNRNNPRRKWEESELVDESGTIIGKIAPATDKDIGLFPEGEISKGAKVLHTNNATLYFRDADTNNIQDKQSYVIQQGDTWRVVSISNRTNDGAYRRYGLVRHISRKVEP